VVTPNPKMPARASKKAVEQKEARRVKPWLGELEGDRLGWRKMLKSIKIRT
jgi:hypothetical protein